MTLQSAVEVLRSLADGAPDAPGRVVRVDDEGGTWVRIDAPSTRGAMTLGMMAEWASHVATLVAEPASGWVVVSGAGGQFCSGGHVGQLLGHLKDRHAVAAMCDAMWTVSAALRSMARPVLAAVDGAAVGGGVELLLAADQVVATPGSTLHLAQVGLGIAPGWGGHEGLEARVGPHRARALWWTAPRLTASEALVAGLIDEVLPDVEPATVSAWLARRFPAPSRALGTVKRMGAVPRAEAVSAFASVFGGVDHRAALARRR